MISYIFLRFMIVAVGIMPFRMMYVFSDVMFFVIYHVIGYRRNVVLVNLCSSFPEKNKDEIHLLTKKFYHHLCDISLEGIKGFTLNEKELIRRHHILNPELADYYFDKGVSTIAVPGHYNNWEWGSLSPGLQIKYPIVGIYKSMSNTRVDAFARKHRAIFKTRLASLKETASTFNELSGMPHVYLMASDQSPTNLKDCYWIDFLNHDTPWLHGPEKYARKYNLPVIYVDIQKVKRGFYELKLVLLTEDPATLPNGEITRLYTQHLEKSILHEPAYWLWSHKRWKHNRERI
jgi:KDO2-lipid IV(A) lauroyltransferase